MAVTPIPSRDIIALDAEDVVTVMRRSGFDDDQILAQGTEIRNALSTTGSARISVGKKTEALFMVVDRYIHVSSRLRGNFIYDTQTKDIR
jgi:hypothetical protein